MGLVYDITQDYLYQQGQEQGQQEMQRKMIVKMLEDKTLSFEKIAAFAQVPVEYVQQIVEESKK